MSRSVGSEFGGILQAVRRGLRGGSPGARSTTRRARRWIVPNTGS